MEFYEDNFMSQVQEHINEGGDPNHCPKGTWSLLHLGAEFGNIEAIQFLIASGADLNIRDKQGWTPLHLAVDADIDGAVQTGRKITFGAARTLIEAGADVAIVNLDGEVAGDIARKYGEDIFLSYQSICT